MSVFAFLFIVALAANVIAGGFFVYQIYESWRIDRGWQRIRREEQKRRKILGLKPGITL